MVHDGVDLRLGHHQEVTGLTLPAAEKWVGRAQDAVTQHSWSQEELLDIAASPGRPAE